MLVTTAADVRGLMTIVVVLLIGAAQAVNFPRPGKQPTGNLLKATNDKDPRCHHPTTHNCNTSVYQILDWELSAWFYHSLFKSCRPLYSVRGETMCIENQDLPKTREMCEELCGESCTMSNGSIGICTFGQMCQIINNKPSAHPRPCGSYNVNCCPKVSDSDLDDELGNRINGVSQSSSGNETQYIYRFPKQ